ncbi:hypothetical protein [Pseudofulvimonas gallinarii]|uniref:Uncharacterized protein n=1 Tax=Pseudofulvimonas gallinarii TaxID=634155 RepID=A0A4R3LDL5_9GAMM|nr:hypothetical protein [Pseudofulvimonas gallinarii]TCS98241.1 hypothetical protein EDC25_10995 [Pseudofulvimonas gallinarii]
MFSADHVKDDGTRQTLTLHRLADTAIKRHVKVKGNFNPFDPADEQYGETLRQRRLLEADGTGHSGAPCTARNTADVQYADVRSPRKPGGTITTSSHG